MEIFLTDLHGSFAEALASLPSQRGAPVVPKPPRRSLFQIFFKGEGLTAAPSQKAVPPPRCFTPDELLKIANIRKNDPVVRSYFASIAELAERDETTESADGLYLRGLNDALDAYLRFDERRSKIERAIRKIGSIGSHEEERRHLEGRLAAVRDDVARQVLHNALDQLERRAISFDALQIDLERIEARKSMISQRLAAVRELLIRDSLSTGESTGDGGGLALLQELNDDLAKDAVFAQQAEAEHILQSIVP